jgi:D-beta-D-heptose 7-phosphate kinase/D-beta-D-heptose 1-phosphate adenosyltransferase
MEENPILVIGDIMLDRYIYGTVERICPEAPVPVLNYKHEKEYIGGAGVVADSLVKLGHQTKIISVVGDDEEGKMIIELCKKANIANEGIFQEKNRQTTVKTRYVAISPFWQYILRMDKEQTHPITSETEEKITKKAIEEIAKCSCVIISDYAKGMMTKKIIETVIEESKRQKKMLIVDTKGKIIDYKGADIIAPNRKELFDNSGKKQTKDINVIKRITKELAEKMNCTIIVKLGEEGVLLIDKEKDLLLPSEAKKIVNVSGAGDVFIAILASEITNGKPIEEAVRIANKGAGIAIGKENPRITREELYGESGIS